MNAHVRLLAQRSVGQVVLHVEKHGVARLRESGSAKIRLPVGSRDAILINTGGGIAGGDRFDLDISAGVDAKLTITSQAAERVYCTLGPAGVVESRLNVESGAELFWLPQETILFDGASLQRKYSVSLAENTRFLAVEPVVLGRLEMGETVETALLRDCWRVERAGRLVHADNLHLQAPFTPSQAKLGTARAFATLLYIAEDAAKYLDDVRAAIGENGAASVWGGKLVARILAQDGFRLRQRLIPALCAIVGRKNLPKPWTF